MNVGIMYPRSKAHPMLMQDFIDGTKTFIGTHPGTDINLITESIGFGGSEKEVYEKAEKLLMIEGVDVLVAFIGEKVMDILLPLLQATGKLLLVVHPGANYPQRWIPERNIIHLTLQDAFLSFLTGNEAGKVASKDGIVASTFYDCGYLHLAVMVNGFTKAGGNVLFNYVNKQPCDDSFDIKELADYLTATKTSHTMLSLFDELPASLFYDRLNQHEKAGEQALFVSPMMLQPQAFANQHGGYKFSIEGYSPWQAEVEIPAATEFCDAFLLKTKRKGGLFSLLGWETGMILKQVADTVSSGFEDGATLAVALQKIRFNSPRGEMILDPGTNYFIAPIVQCRMEASQDKMTTKHLDFPLTAWSDYIQCTTTGAGSGWTNTYLCY